MKKIVASVSLVALGAAGLQSVSGAVLDSDSSKPWSVSAKLRGFYDDNPNGVPNNARGSFGFEISPSLGLHLNLDQTTIGFGYSYSGKYYDRSVNGNGNGNGNQHWSHTHTFDFNLDHSFSERFSVAVTDSFVIGQEPDVLRAGNTETVFQRVPGDNIRNYGAIIFSAQLTPLFGLEVGYANAFYDYEDSGAGMPIGFPIVPSLSGGLDRMEHMAHIDTRWQLSPETVAVFGYQYGETVYTGDEFISGVTLAPGIFLNPLMSDSRNSRSHYVYVGADQTFNPDFSGSLRVGGQFTDYYNSPNNQTDVSPYVMASLNYTYAPGSYVQGGFTYHKNASDVLSVDANNQITLDAESAVVFFTLNHQITSKLSGSLTGQIQHSTQNGGSANSDVDMYYLAGLNFQYRFNPHLLAEIGYNFDKLESDINGRHFTRNRCYLGITASY